VVATSHQPPADDAITSPQHHPRQLDARLITTSDESFYRGSAAAAPSYVEADHSRADDYYQVEGTGLAEHYIAGPGAVRRVGDCEHATP